MANSHHTTVVCLIDNVLVYRRTQAEHNQRLSDMYRFDKGCQFSTTTIRQVVAQRGINVKVQAMLELKTLTNVKELHRFLGMASKFSLNLAEETKDLLNTKSHWTWVNPKETAFTNLKQILSSNRS